MEENPEAPGGLAARLAPLATGAGIFLLYLAFPSYRHNFDGVACAVAVELGDLRHLTHGNHLLYGVAGYAFHGLLVSLGLKLSALWALQIFDSLLGAAGVAVFQRTLRRCGLGARHAAACSIGLGLSFGWWLWSLEAQVYLLGALFLALSLEECLRDEPSPYRLALWHGLAMLTHGANALFFPVAVYNLWRSGLQPRGATSKYIVAAAGLVLAGYAAAACLWVRPASLDEARLWLLGSVALGEGRTVLWHGVPFLQGLGLWLRTGARAVSPVLPLALPLWGAAAWALWKTRGKEFPLVASAWLWLGSYALLFSQWEPFTLVYRVSDLLPLWLAAAVASKDLAAGARSRFLLPGFLLTLGAVNFGVGILPGTRPENNAPLQNALWIKAATPEKAWVAALGADEVYLPYFAGRRTLNLRYLAAPGAVSARLWELLESGETVYATSETLNACKDCPTFLDLETVGRRKGVTLYRIRSVAD